MSKLYADSVSFQHLANRHANHAADLSNGPLAPAHCKRAHDAISSWADYSPTPLIKLDGLANRLNVSGLYYKDEAGRFGLGSFKSLGGAYAVSVILLEVVKKATGQATSIEALVAGTHHEITSAVTVTCATDGNHGRSVAWGANRFGCQCIIYIHKSVSDGRKQAIEAYGAQVVRVNGNYDDSIRVAAADAEKHAWVVVSDTSYPGYLDIPADVTRGYTVLADEALEQMGDTHLTHVFLQGGVGAFAAAVIARIRAHPTAHNTRIIVVEPENAACIYESLKAGDPVAVTGDLDTIMAGLACGEVSLIAFDILKPGVDDVLVVPDSAAVTSMQLLAAGIDGDKPLVSGESAVAGLAGLGIARGNDSLSEALQLDATSCVLVIGTEGATDPEVYVQLVGCTPEAVIRAEAPAHS